MKLLLISILLLAVCVSSVPAGKAQSEKEQSVFAQIEKAALDELKQANIPGAALAIVSGDKIVFAKGFGVASVETGAPVTPDTLFRIGSVTKMFTATVLVTLAEQRKIKLNEPVGNYAKGLNPLLARLTTHQLLSHTAGIVDRVIDYGPQDEAALATTIRGWGEDYILTEPGRFFSYANPGYAIAGMVIEEVGGSRYADLMSELVFKPLEMSHTTFRPTMAMTYPLSQGHNAFGGAPAKVARPFANNTVFWPDGFMFSSVNDLARFAIAVMNKGQVDGRQVISPSVIAKLTEPNADTISLYDNAKYGYGFFIRVYRGARVFEHGGAINGFGCLIRIAPDHKFAVIAMGNKTDEALDQTAAKAFELMLPVPSREETRALKELPMSETEMRDYVGIYQLPYRRIELLMKDGKLLFKSGNSERIVKKIGDSRFMATLPAESRGLEFSMIRTAAGKVEFLHAGGRAMRKLEQ
jgi:CubicO group peptidase (beta-lactamase class C family)